MEPNARETFVANLRALMERRNMSQSQLAEMIGKPISTVHEWYVGRRYPRVDCMQQLADLFGIRMSELIGKDSEPVVVGVTFRDFEMKLSDEEMILVAEYRAATPEAQMFAMEILHNHKKNAASKATGA